MLNTSPVNLLGGGPGRPASRLGPGVTCFTGPIYNLKYCSQKIFPRLRPIK